MAGKETPRQKMINMMYLIFIAMLALNLSKQILQSFGVMNAELTDTNKELEVRNDQFMQGLEEKAQEQADKYLDLKLKADSIRTISTTFYDFLEATKEAAYLKPLISLKYILMGKSIKKEVRSLSKKWIISEIYSLR